MPLNLTMSATYRGLRRHHVPAEVGTITEVSSGSGGGRRAPAAPPHLAVAEATFDGGVAAPPSTARTR